MSTGSMPTPEAPLNPWFSMWTEPRRTMRQILNRGPDDMVYLLAAIGGIGRSLDQASLRSAGDQLSVPGILLLAIPIGGISGMILLWLSTYVVHWTGDLFEGRGSTLEVRAALAWPNVFSAWALLLWIPELLLFGTDLFTTETPYLDANPRMSMLFLCFAPVEIGLATWGVVVSLKCLGEAQRYSAWKALGNLIVAALAIVIPLVFLVAVLTWLLS